MRKIIFIIILLLIVGGFGYKYIYQSHRDISSEKPDFTIDSGDLINEFVVNAELANHKYLNKTIKIMGKVTEINDGTISLNDAVLCYMIQSEIDNSILNSKIVIKGRFIGYDDLLEELKIDQSSILNN